MTIANAGTGKFASANGFSLTPGGAGNFILLSVICTSTSQWATSITNSGNVTWSVLDPVSPHRVFSGNAVTETVFIGKVNSTAAQSQTISFNSGSPAVRVAWQEFSTTAGFALIALDASGTTDTAAGGSFPPVTPARSGDTYWSFIWDNGTGAAGSTAGYTYAVDSINGNLQCYNTSCANAAQTPNIGDANGTAGTGVMVYEATGATASAALAAGTGTAQAPSVTAGGSATAQAIAAAAAGTASQPPVSTVRDTTGFPYHKLGRKVELLLNGTWTDITAYVQLRSDITISPFGRTNETSSMEPAQLTLTLDNRSGRFTPGNSLGAYYPYVQLNTQIRVSVNDTSVNGTAYSGYRFWGEVSSWPAAWDESGRDAYAQVTASGIWRRLSQSTKRLGSPYTRYNSINIRNAWTLASYWPMEDGGGSAALANLVAGQAAMTVSSGTPTLSSVSAFPGSDAIPVLNGAVLNGLINTSANPSNVLWRFNMFLPSGGDAGASGVIARMTTSGTVARVEVSLHASGGGPLTIAGYSSGGTQLFTGSSTLNVWGIPLMVQVGLAQSGGSVTWSLRTMLPGAATANTTVTGSITGTVSDSTGVVFNVTGTKYQGTAVGQCAVIYGNPVITDAAAALAGWPGEFAGARFLRVCAEQGIPAVLTGSPTSGTPMGPQVDDTLANVLQMIEATDGGLLYETRSQLGLGYRTLATLQNQASQLTLNYNAQQLSAPLSPAVDDQLTRNDVTLTNYDGYSVRVYLASGARSIQSPPNGVGTGYEYTRSVSSTDHAQVNALGQQLLNCGTVSDSRYPTVTVNLARVTTAGLFAAVPAMDPGDYLTLANMPAYGGSATQKQLVWGWTETLGAKTWTFTFNTIPEAPFESGFAPGTAVTGQVPGSPTTLSQSGSVSGAQIAESAISLFSLAQQVLTYQFGGITSTIDSAAPTAPADGNLWFDSGNGFQIKRWDAAGGTWVPVVFDGDNILGAGTITAGLLAADAVVAGNIAAGTVTANELAAGIVKAGIVNGTLISGAQFVAYGTTGEILVYSGTPASGNLVMSVSAAAGTDGQGNAYKAGVWIYDSGGNSMGMVPGGGSAASQLALSTGAATPTPPAGTAAVYAAASGAVQAVDGTDGQTYSVSSRRSIVPTVDQNVTSTSMNTWASSPVAAGSSARVYRVHAVAFVSPNASGGKVGFQWIGPAGVSGHIDFCYAAGTSTSNSGALNQGSSSGSVAPAFVSGTEQTVTIEGAFSVPAGTSGTFALQAAIATTTCIIRAYSFLDIMPVLYYLHEKSRRREPLPAQPQADSEGKREGLCTRVHQVRQASRGLGAGAWDLGRRARRLPADVHGMPCTVRPGHPGWLLRQRPRQDRGKHLDADHA
jgi:hypothetical protein